MPGPLRKWSASTVDIAGHLLAAAEPQLTEAVARELGRPQRTVRELLDRLHEGRLVTRMPITTGEPGRPPWGYWLGKEQTPAAERAVHTPPALLDLDRKDAPDRFAEDTGNESGRGGGADPGRAPHHIPRSNPGSPVSPPETAGQLGRGQELVLVDVSGPGFSDLLEALSGTRTADEAVWTARVGNELAFAFDGDAAPSDAGDLLAVLSGARLPVRQATISAVAPADQLISRAKRIAPEIRRARSERDAHNAPQ